MVAWGGLGAVLGAAVPWLYLLVGQGRLLRMGSQCDRAIGMLVMGPVLRPYERYVATGEELLLPQNMIAILVTLTLFWGAVGTATAAGAWLLLRALRRPTK